MNCALHFNAEATEICESCRKPVCAECLKKTAPLKLILGCVCVECYESKLSAAIELQKIKKRGIIILGLLSVLTFIIGVVLMISGGIDIKNSLDTFALIKMGIGYSLCGVFSVMSVWANNEGKPFPIRIAKALFSAIFGALLTVLLWSGIIQKLAECNEETIACSEALLSVRRYRQSLE